MGSLGMGSRTVAESAAKYSGEMSVVAKAAVVGDLDDRLTCVQGRPAMQKTRGVIQPDRIDEMRAGRAPRREELLKVAQRDPCFRRDLARTERRFGKAVPHDAANAGEKLVRMKGARRGICRRK